MHILILDFHPLQSAFIQRALKYEGIGADRCLPHNLFQIWYGQYDAVIIALKNWKRPTFKEIQARLEMLGRVPILFTSRHNPPELIDDIIRNNIYLEFANAEAPFIQTSQKLKKLIHHNQNIQETPRYLVVEDIEIDFETHSVRRRDQMIPLRNREFSLLGCLMQHADKVLTRTYLLEQVWDRNTSILSNTVDVHISRLRRKVDGGFKQKRIVTIPCVGYKLSTTH